MAPGLCCGRGGQTAVEPEVSPPPGKKAGQYLAPEEAATGAALHDPKPATQFEAPQSKPAAIESENPPRQEPKATATPPPAAPKELVLLHFNDVYEIDQRDRDPVGGVARFMTKLHSFNHENPCVLFSGDFLAPSLLSTSTKGMHMVKLFNRMNIKACCLGNHDFDHGLEACEAAMAASNFPYLLSNVIDLKTGTQLGGAKRTLVLEHAGVRIGFMGLIEEEWLATLNCIEPSRVKYTDYVAEARELNAKLRGEEKCDMVIALTHSRVPNDKRLAEECPFLDLVLGGHDHDSFRRVVGQVPVIKSGTDFRELTRIAVTLPSRPGERCTIKWDVAYVTSEVPEDEEAAALVEEYGRELSKTMDQVIGTLGDDLDFKFGHIRTKETNGSNFVADCMRAAMPGTDVALLNSGTLRADDILPAGDLKMRDLNTLLPMLDELCVVQLTGQQLLRALENGVSQWPKLEGRFPAVSGVTLRFDGTREPGARIDVDSVRIGGEPFAQTGRTYSVIIKNYLRSGKDGYDVFRECKVLHDSDATPMLPVLMRDVLHKHYDELTAALAKPGAKREDVIRTHAIRAVVDGRIINTAHDDGEEASSASTKEAPALKASPGAAPASNPNVAPQEVVTLASAQAAGAGAPAEANENSADGAVDAPAAAE